MPCKLLFVIHSRWLRKLAVSSVLYLFIVWIVCAFWFCT